MRFILPAEKTLKGLFVPKELVRSTQKHRAEVWDKEKQRQLKLVTRVHKIDVAVQSPHQHLCADLRMNKDLSTPYICAKHISEHIMKGSCLAEIQDLKDEHDGEVDQWSLWDMHRPLSKECRLRFHDFDVLDPQIANRIYKAYWRSCSFVLGALLEKAFKDQFRVQLHSWPGADYRSGSFVYDCQIEGLKDWTPTQEELNILSLQAMSEWRQESRAFEPLEIPLTVAEEMFKDNPFKLEQLPSISEQGEKEKIKVYRSGEHVDISSGPMISSPAQIGNYAITAVYPIETDWGRLFRFQGMSLPASQRLNSWTWTVVTNFSKSFNRMKLPSRETYNQEKLLDKS